MIKDSNDRIIATISKEQKMELEKYCKDNNMSKSMAISLALSIMFQAGYKLGDVIGQMILDKRVISSNENYEDL